MAKRKRALLLDLDNTLIDRDAAFLAWLESLRQEAPALDVAGAVALDRGGYGDERSLFGALGVALGTSPARARARHEHELPGFVSLKDDAALLLGAFDGAVVVVTNGASSLQRAKLRAADLDARVDAVVVSSEHGRSKPHPSIFREALTRASATADEALMVGDHPVSDVGGALAAGIAACMVRTRWFEVPTGVRAIDLLTEVAW